MLSAKKLQELSVFCEFFDFFLIKEVFQPLLPERLPCYDFTPVTHSALGIPFGQDR